MEVQQGIGPSQLRSLSSSQVHDCTFCVCGSTGVFDVVVRTCCKELATQTLSYMSAMCCTTATRPQYAMHSRQWSLVHDAGRLVRRA